MAALGLAGLKSGIGLDLYLAKIGISTPDKAVEGLYEIAKRLAGQYRAISELDEDIKQRVLQILATFAYQDYSRSAASVRQCECCAGEGFIEAEVFTMKSAMGKMERSAETKIVLLDKPLPCNALKPKREVVRALCKACSGKKVISNSCRCHGKGVVLDKVQTELQGIPVNKECPKCSGRGYARLPAENVRRAICSDAMELTEPTWRRNFKPFYEGLITQCHKEESVADIMLSSVTR
jgi:RecJ-like exonuclease